MKTGVKVADAMTKSPVFVAPSTTVYDVAKHMLKKKVGCVLVKDQNRLLGIITEKDLVERVLAKNKSQKKVKAKDIMTAHMHIIDPSQDLHEAMIKMNKASVRRLPVVRNNRLIGLLTMKDILAIEPQLFDLALEKIRVREETYKPLYLNLKLGFCERCGKKGKLTRVDEELLCEICKRV